MENSELKKLFEQIKTGDKEALEKIYNDMKTPVYTVIMRITHDRMLSEDIMQEIFVKLFKSPPQFPVENPRAWIFKMARNLAIDSTRKQKQLVSYDELEECIPQPEADYGEHVDVENALNRLDSDSRQIVTLHINGGMKFREISEIMSIPLGTALWRYQKAIDKLRILLGGSI